MNGISDFGLLVSDSVIERLGWVLVHSLWQFLLVGTLAFAALRTLRHRSAQARYGVLVGMMLLSLALPVATWMLQPNGSAIVARGNESEEATGASINSPKLITDDSTAINAMNGDLADSKMDDATIGDPPRTLETGNERVVDSQIQAGPLQVGADSDWAAATTSVLRPWLGWIVACWAFGILICLLRPLIGLFALYRLKRVGVTNAPKEIQALLRRVASRLGLRRGVQVCESTLAQVPMVVGYAKPVILLPVSLLTNIPTKQLESILAHELAHIRRHDFAVNMIQVLVETVFFYHPAVWWLSHRIRIEREHCCDDLAVDVVSNRMEYGRALIAVEELRGRSSTLSLGASDGSMLQRIRRIARHPNERSGISAWSSLILVAGLVGIFVFINLLSFQGAASSSEAAESSNLPLNSIPVSEGEESVLPASNDELEFLAAYPKLKQLTLDMTEDEFLEIVKRNELKPEKSVAGGSRHYMIPADEDHSVIVMFGNNGDKCSGIQRIRADNRQGPLRVLREPAFRLPGHSNLLCLGFDDNDDDLVVVSTYHFATIRRWDLVDKKLKSEVMLKSDQHLRPFSDGTFKLSGDRRKVVAATDDFVGIWDTTTGKLLKKLPFPKKEWEYDCIRKLTCTPDLSVIVGHLTTSFSRTTRIYDARVIVWDAESGDAGRIITDPRGTELVSIALSNDGKLLATTNGAGAKVWNTSTGEQVRTVPNDNSDRKDIDPNRKRWSNHVWRVQISPDGSQLAVGDTLGVKLWGIKSGKLLRQLDGQYQFSSGIGTDSLVFSNDGQLLARTGTSSKETGSVIPIWSTRTGEKLFELHTRSVSGAFSNDGKRFAVGLSDRKIAIAVWQLYGKASDEDLGFEPVPEPLQDKVEVGSHYRGKKVNEFIDKWQPKWGEAQNGFQLGIALTQPEAQFRPGQRVPMVIFFRNTGDKAQQLDMRPNLFWNTPKVVNAAGGSIDFEKTALLGTTSHYRPLLQPGEAYGPLYLNFGLGENPRPGEQIWAPFFKSPVPGKYKLTQSVPIQVAEPDGGDRKLKEDWTPGVLNSGEIEIEIVDVRR